MTAHHSQPGRKPGQHFLQIPGPTIVPGRIEQAMTAPIIDHRGPEFSALTLRIGEGLKSIFKTENPVVVFPGSGTGAWEAALVNTMSAGERVLTVETGQFSLLWETMARKLGLDTQVIETDWRTGVDANAVEAALNADTDKTIKAVCIVHNETATGCRSWVEEIRAALDAAKHPALLMVDTVSSLGVMDYQHDSWGVDVTVCGSQKGMMLPPGLSFTAVSDKAIAASKAANLPRSYFSWDEMLVANPKGFFPYTPATSLLYGLEEAIKMMHEEGLDAIFARHDLLAAGVRAAVEGWGLEILCKDPKYYSPAVTAVKMPEGHDADKFRKIALDTYNIALGTGLNRLAGKVFRIGHLADTNQLTIMGALAGVELGLEAAGVPHEKNGLNAAMAVFAKANKSAGITSAAA
ncbi:MAG: aminotransferase class V-fold PLP-dependent enzyme [Pseudomonadota bacterium]